VKTDVSFAYGEISDSVFNKLTADFVIAQCPDSHVISSHIRSRHSLETLIAMPTSLSHLSPQVVVLNDLAPVYLCVGWMHILHDL
jgi:hypothetical protein